MLKEDLDDGNMDQITKKTDFGLEAAKEIKKIYESGNYDDIIQSRLNSTHPKRNYYKKLIQ